MMSRHSYDVSPIDIAWKVHLIMEKNGGGEDPYLKLKKETTDAAKEHVDEVRKRIDSSGDRLREAVIGSIAGNVVDYGAKNLLDLGETLEKAERIGLTVDHYDEFKNGIARSDKLYFLLDNSGEVVLDMILMEEIHRFDPDIEIKAVVKRDPILNDVTEEDAVYAGMDQLEGVDIVKLPNPGWVERDFVGDLVREEGNMVISKGQGNFESLSNVCGVFFLFVAKCDHVANVVGVEVGDMILKYNIDP